MTDEQKAELHDLLDTLVWAQLSVQQCKREKALRNVEAFVDRVAGEKHVATWPAEWHE